MGRDKRIPPTMIVTTKLSMMICTVLGANRNLFFI